MHSVVPAELRQIEHSRALIGAAFNLHRDLRLLRGLMLAAVLVLLCHRNETANAQTKLDFSTYDVPLYEQILNRTRTTISARLGNTPNTRDRYFIIPFAYQNNSNDPEFSHSFITVVRVLAAGKKPRIASELRTGSYKRWNFEAYNISWLPEDFIENPNLCVFDGFGSRLFPTSNRCPVSEGKNFNLEDTIRIAVNAKVAVGMWGPYEITKEGFDLGIRRKQLLDSGNIKYRADDRLHRKDRIAINCFHAMAGLDELFPNGGLFGTGFKMWGLNGTSRVLIEYANRSKYKRLLLEAVDVKRDRYGFVYAPERNAQHVYNPFKQASTYYH